MDATTTPRRVLITGGASGIGLAVATAFLDEGAQVGIISRTRQTIGHALEGPLAGYAERVHTVVADVAQEAAVQAGIEELATGMGGIDTVVAAAAKDRRIEALTAPR